MPVLRSLGVLAAALLSAAAVAQPVDHREAKEFFARYVSLANRQDPSLADQYASDARIRAKQRLPNGSIRLIELTGEQYRKLIRQTYSGQVSQRDRNEYSDVVIESTASQTRIRAKRYSVHKCHWDLDYNIVIARQPDGRLRIVEENIDTHPQATC
ncbi:MAG TPA: hypothetical protein VM491_11310 [Burkholderiaceae bacterium]|nr:hypothetical protein [Burkholderiaceae bacterium]